ncbi:SDR family NAD(P)-dependent oxidoreductase [Ramlibacter sp.]|uniref:SDR family NAD(P)-dependent oxidoreductase n=1 Tax=Ramlibacter sp. TaxID=1917967 RepID=UPI003D14644B
MTHDNKPLRGRTAIVTGSGRNIGRAIALDFARQGANVVINGHSNAAALEEVAAEARALGVEAMTAIVDVGDAAAVQGMVDAAAQRFGSVDIAVSNVSVREHTPFLDISVDDWQRVLNTNLSSAFYLARACLPHMKAKRWGRIIHISGRDGFSPKANRAHNVTCKAGTFALAKAIAIEFGEFGITANAVAPGIIDTVRDAAHYPAAGDVNGFEARRLAMPLRRLGDANDIAGACSYLCSTAGGYVTGQILHVNGGEFMF